LIVVLSAFAGAWAAGPGGSLLPLLDAAVHAAAAGVVVRTSRPDGTPLHLRWGRQLDIRRVGAEFDDNQGAISEAKLAAYIAKYTTKGTNATTGADRPIRSERHLAHLTASPHCKTMMRTAWILGGLEQYRDLNLRKWCHMLGFRGHFLTKSRYYSTTFTEIRGERKLFRRQEFLALQGIDDQVPVTVVSHWSFAGAGYRDDAESELAAAIASRITSREPSRSRVEGGYPQWTKHT
jgi:hypothetical protein